MNENSVDIFLSYSRADAEAADRIREQLAKKYTVWQDTVELLVGQDIVQRVFGGITRCRYFAILLTPRSVESRWVHEELSTAKILAIEGKTILLPLLYEDCDIPGPLLSKQFIDFSDSFERGMQELENALNIYEGQNGDLPEGIFASPAHLGDKRETLLNAINDGDKLYLVMDLGGTKAYLSLMNSEAQRIYDRKWATQGHGDPEKLLEFIVTCIFQTLEAIRKECGISREEVERRIQAFGIAVPGPTDSDQGIVLNAPNLNISNFHLKEALEDVWPTIPTFVDNDVNLGVLGETWKGVAKGYEHVVGIIIGTGIGGGIVIDGRIYRGATKAAGEIGHMILDFDSPYICPCGQRGCFEALASRKSMARDISARKSNQGDNDISWLESNLGTNDLIDDYVNGDSDTVAVVNHAARVCGKAAFSVLNAYNPDILFFSGGFVRQLTDKGLEDQFLKPVLEEAEKCMDALYGSIDKRVPIVVGTADNAMLVGACKMAIDNSSERRVYSKTDMIEILVEGMTESDLQLLQSLYRRKTHIISRDPNHDFREERLRVLRNRGLIETEPGPSFKKSSKVRISGLGRIVAEELFP
jgi:glucokinase